MTDVSTIVQLIRAAKLDLSNEKRAQAELAGVLTEAGISFEREVRMSAGDIVDFLIEGIAVELKLKGAKKIDIYHQLVRYAKHDRVIKIVLASNLSMGLPQTIEGKDAYFVKLGEAWL